MESDYIKRSMAVKAFINAEELYEPEWGNKRFSLTDVEEILNGVVPADVRPKGVWMPIIEGNEYGEAIQVGCYCSQCGEQLQSEPYYCPNCGAKMGGEPNG